MVSFEFRHAYIDLLTGKKHTRKTIELKPYGFIWALIK